MGASLRPTVVVGLAVEARLARPLRWPIAIGGGGYEGAHAAAERAVRDGAEALLSFGLAGGLDPGLRPGTLLLPAEVIIDGLRISTDAALRARFGTAPSPPLLGAAAPVASAADKRRLFEATGAVAVDLESGAVARVATAHRLPFAVLRAVCDPAGRDLPPAALIALDRHGAIGLARVLGSVLTHPGQLPSLAALAADATAARRALRLAVSRLT
jgi:adenosylhomocysteine nucleosidase